MGIEIKNALTVLPGAQAQRRCVYIEGDTITSVDKRPAGFNSDDVLDASGMLLIPGLINAHTHAYMTLFRNWADGLDFNSWLFGKIMPIEDRLTPEDAYWSALLACLEMIKSGCTCFLDMHMFPESSVRAAAEAGIRAVISRGLSGGEDDPDGGARRD